jgi:glutathione synthase/RimK-type ligase-like ATP-grasp enzyme
MRNASGKAGDLPEIDLTGEAIRFISMKVAIHSPFSKASPETAIYQQILDYNGIDIQHVHMGRADFWINLSQVDAFICKWGHTHDEYQLAHTYLPIIENYAKVRVFPNQATCWHYDDKIRQDILLKQAGFPFVESNVFWCRGEALEWLEKARFPLVFKLSKGAGARSVYLVHDFNEARRFVVKMFKHGISEDNISPAQIFKTKNGDLLASVKEIVRIVRNRMTGESVFWQKNKNYAYFQKFCPKNAWDTRVTTAGLRAHAFRRFVRDGDFRASGSNKWDITPDNIDLRMIRIALDISKHFGFQAMAYDFVLDEDNNPMIVEISYCYGGAGYPDFMNGFWDDNLTWHPGRYWPQYFELVDLLQNQDLKCPKIEIKTKYQKAEIIS